MIDVPVDAGDDGVVVTTVSAKTVRTDVRSDLVIAVLAWVVINGLGGAMLGVGVDMLADLDIVAVVAAVIALEGFVAVSCVGDVRAGVWTGTAIEIDVVTIVTRVGMVVVLIADTITDFVPGIDVDV